MTTIAWDGSTLASDSQSTSNDVICTLNEQKIFTPTEKQWSVNGEVVLAVGTAGDCGIELQLFEMMEAGLTHKSQFTPEPSFTALAVTGKGRMWIISKNTGDAHASISLQLDGYATGSGGMIARAAMHCGKDAIGAVEVATQLDVFSGGKIQSFTAKEPMMRREIPLSCC
ncbi:hypothetical protein [Pantoea stewartii]|uniref:hypothetical protein n=1 Tax=Pantoea stewartii TaxID=66269 RepID=UPI0012445FB9|nr:hypothetical protein [Pantoea stewartii]KAB0556220.1 hypothetical protein F7Q90_08565 [Pantoea stewartii subsp. stewartii]